MSKKKVFIVDDDQDFLQLAQIALKDSDYTPVLISHPGEIISNAKKAAPDLIILDLNYQPGKNSSLLDQGEFFILVKEREKFLKNVPLVFCSSDKQFAQTVNFKFLGAQDFFIKPMTPKQLLESVKAQFK
jgi:DNA-binding NtrC family response regulator